MAFIALGVWLQAVWPLPLFSTLSGSGSMLVVMGSIAVLGSIRQLVCAGTPVQPFKAAVTLVTGGQYRQTRNPIYPGMRLMYLGLSFYAGNSWVIALTVSTFAVVQNGVIQLEEQHLLARFGDGYGDYCMRV